MKTISDEDAAILTAVLADAITTAEMQAAAVKAEPGITKQSISYVEDIPEDIEGHLADLKRIYKELS